jgi:hypothetical protein
MTATFIRRRTEDCKPLSEGMISVEGVTYSVPEGQRPDVFEETIRRRFFWRRERLGVGLPARR